MESEKARGTMSLDRTAIVGVHEGAEEEGGNKDEEDKRRSETISRTRRRPHRGEGNSCEKRRQGARLRVDENGVSVIKKGPPNCNRALPGGLA